MDKMKFRVDNKEQSEALQKVLFSLGYSWSGNTEIFNPTYDRIGFIYTNLYDGETNDLSWDAVGADEHFSKQHPEEYITKKFIEQQKEPALMKPNLDLLRKAYIIIDAIPNKTFDLDDIVRTLNNGSELCEERGCGTIACAAGWLGMSPEFQALGLKVDKETEELTLNGEWTFYDEALAKILNISEQQATDLFTAAGSSRYDKKSEYKNHKKLWKKRVRKFLKEQAELGNT